MQGIILKIQIKDSVLPYFHQYPQSHKGFTNQRLLLQNQKTSHGFSLILHDGKDKSATKIDGNTSYMNSCSAHEKEASLGDQKFSLRK